jgi:hypothetical protein
LNLPQRERKIEQQKQLTAKVGECLLIVSGSTAPSPSARRAGRDVRLNRQPVAHARTRGERRRRVAGQFVPCQTTVRTVQPVVLTKSSEILTLVGPEFSDCRHSTFETGPAAFNVS